MKTLKVYLSLLVISFPFLILAQPSWSRFTPQPQEHTINDMVKIPNTSKIIAVCDGSTYMITEDLGDSWQLFTNPAEKENEYSLFSICFLDENTGFISGSYESILKTTDGGMTWEEVYFGGSFYNWSGYYDFVFCNPTTGIAVGTEGKIIRTTDGGDNWTPVVSGVDFDLFAVDCCTEEKVFAIGDENTYFLISYDGGETWNNYTIIPSISGGTLKDILFTNNTIGFITVDQGMSSKVLITENGGNNWISIWEASNEGYFPNKIEFFDDSHGVISCRRYEHKSGILMTTDGGLSWEEFPIGEYSWDVDKAITMTDNNEVIMAGKMGMIFQSDFENQEWLKKSERTFWGHIYKTQFIDDLMGFTVAVNHSGGFDYEMMKTINGGLSWNTIITDDEIMSFHFVNNQTGYYTIQKEATEIYKTLNGGSSWIMQDSGSFDFGPICTKFYNESLGIICGLNDIIRTQDGGNTWEQVYNGVFTDDHFDIHFKTENEILVSGSYFIYETNLMWSTNGGDTWNSEILGDYGHAYDIEFINPDTGFLACANNMILKTTNGGITWEETNINSVEGTEFLKIQFPSLNIGYASARGPGNTFFMTIDHGATWEPIETPSTSGIYDFNFFNDETGLAFGENGVVLKTGEFLDLNPPVNFQLELGYNCPMTIFYLSWEEPDLTNTPDLAGYNVYRNDTLLINLGTNSFEFEEELSPFGGWGPEVCYYITAVYENPSGESIPTEELCGGWLTKVEQNKLEETELQCYPNPFQKNTQIFITNSAKQKGEIRIYDQTGKQILNIPLESESKNIEIPGEQLNPGIYFYQLKTDKGISETRKMIKL